MTDAARLFTDGEAYERMMGRWSRLVGTVFLDWLAAPPGLRWLDVGCGNGAFTEVIIQRNEPSEIVGVDASEQQLAYARVRPGTTMARYELADAQKLPFDDAAFDAAAMALVITFLPDPTAGAREMKRVVRPGGWVATYIWDFLGGGMPFEPIYAAMNALGTPLARRLGMETSREPALRALWEGAGLREVETRAIAVRVAYADFDDFWISSSVPASPTGRAIHEMPADAKERLREHLRRTLPVAADGSIAYEARANAVKGRVPS